METHQIIIYTIILTIVWILIGAFINHKRDYYKHIAGNASGEHLKKLKRDCVGICFINYLLSPLCLCIAVIREISKPWNNK